VAATVPGKRKRSGSTGAMLLAGAVGMLALPSAVLAFSSSFDPQSAPTGASVAAGAFVPSVVDPRLARSITVRALAKGRTFRFTPAATTSRADRLVTVAVRLDAASSRAIVVRGSLAAADRADEGGSISIAPTAYSLGAARGYKSFAENLGGVRGDIPDLATFKPSNGGRGEDGRFAPRVALDDRGNAGRSPRTFNGQSEETVDLGGAYRLSRNLNVTAGVRYQQDRERLVPLTDGRQDSQAVYVGTQFRF
jgi:hypothetical protein